MNFNISKNKSYNLQAQHTNELINLYGVQLKLLITEKINSDDLVFGDYSHLKTDSNKSFEIMGLPESSESWDDIGINFSDFGMVGTENIRLFFSRKTVDTIFGDFDEGKGFKGILGNLIVLPNNKIMEITDIEFEVPGINNLYTESDRKNAYKFTLVTYNNKLVNEASATDLTAPDSQDVDYTQLESYFEELTQEISDVDTEAEVTINTETEKTVINTDEDSVFGKF